MSFGGSTAAANQSVKANRSLARGRDHLFDRDVKYKAWDGKNYVPPKATEEVREKNRRKLAKEIARDRIIWTFSILLGVILLAVYLAYALPATW